MRNSITALFVSFAFTFMVSCDTEVEPTIETLSVNNITGSEAKTGGNITGDGGSEVISRGVCWSTVPQPNLTNSFTTDGAGVGSFASELSDLEPSTQYYVRAYATNAVGTGYGNEITFNTTDEVTATMPTVQTLAITDITGNEANSGGTISDDGGSEITARGLCWNTLPEPNINNSTTSNGAGTGSFTAQITELERNTKYYVRAYATNETGTGYGNEIEFTTSNSIEIKIGSTTYMMHEDATFTTVWGLYKILEPLQDQMERPILKNLLSYHQKVLQKDVQN